MTNEGNKQSPPTTAERQDHQVPSMDANSSARHTLAHILIDKFPDFDQAWPAEVQVKWFEGFDRLMEALGARRR
jgi:hypothetical protein